MNNRRGTRTHRFVAGQWTDAGRAIVIRNGGGDCQVELRYAVSVKPTE